MHRRFPRYCGLLFACLLAGGSPSLRADETWTDAELARQANSLGSDQFAVRQGATRILLSAGPGGVPHLVQAVNAGDAEIRSRAFDILLEHALSRDPHRRAAARGALLELERSGNERVARFAGGAHDRACEAVSAIARIELTQLGALWTSQGSNTQSWKDMRCAVQIGEKWKGGDRSLALLPDLGGVTWLSLESAPVTDDCLVHVAKLDMLERLYLGNSRIKGHGLKQLAPLTGLRYLSLKQLPVTDRHLAELPKLPQLQDLGLDSTQVGNAGLAHLGRFPHVNRLWLDGTKVTDDGLEHLQALQELRTLFLAGTRLNGSGLAELRELPALTYLSLKQTTFQPDGLSYVGQLKQIERLGLDNTNVNDDMLADLSGLSRLRELWLNSSQITDAGLVHLRGLKDLQVIHLDSTEVTSEGVLELQRAIPLLHVTR